MIKNSKVQIVATIGPASSNKETLREMVMHNLDVVRLNFSWGNYAERHDQISIIRQLEQKFSRKIPVIVDLPGLRVQGMNGHTYNHNVKSGLTVHDRAFIQFGVSEEVDYFALSFVGRREDLDECRQIIKNFGGHQKVIAKIERKIAVDNAEQIIANSDAVMIARGDMGNEIPIEQIPFVQEKIIKICKKAGKPVIVATQMLFSMVEHDTPTRAEVTDVTNAIIEGADAIMLSEETTIGKYPVQAVAVMEKIAIESEKHIKKHNVLHALD